MSNANEPSQPCATVRYGEQLDFSGLTKREHAAILLRVPKSGDDEIDAMIREANRRDAAVAAMQGLLSDRRTAIELGEALMLVNDATPGSAAHTNALRKLIGIAAAGHAGAILAELEKKT